MVSFTFGINCGLPFSLHVGNREMLHADGYKVEICISEIGFWIANVPIRISQGHTPICVTYFWGTLLRVHFTSSRKREMLHVVC